MANSIVEKVALNLELNGGEVNGKTKYIKRNYHNVKEDVNDETLFKIANIFGKLGSQPLIGVRKTVTSIISE